MSGSIALGSRVLRVGARGTDVSWVQQRLGNVVVDGVYGRQSSGAVLAFQQAKGLLGDGIVGPRTWKALGADSTAPTVFDPPAAPAGDLAVIVEKALRGVDAFEPQAWAAVLAPEMEKGGITTIDRISPFLANILNETGGLRRLEENLFYSAKRLMEVWPTRFPTLASAEPYAGNPKATGEKVYGGRMGNTLPGDGYRHRGRGGMQTTGKDNYTALAKATGTPIEILVADDSPLLSRQGAAHSAVVFWTAMGANALADRGDTRTIRVRANGGTVGLSNVLKLEGEVRAALA